MNKIVKILYIILGLLMLLFLIIVLCAFNPKLTGAVADLLYPAKDNVSEAVQESAEADITDSTRTPLPADTFQVKQPETEYIAPDKASIKTPAGVTGKNGYEPVEDNTEQVDDEEGEKLQNQASYGETGDGLDFDPLFYPYYDMLDDNLQKLYRQIYANAMALNDVFTPIQPVSQGQLKNVFMAVIGDHPEIFWLDTAYWAKFMRNGACVQIVLQFNKTANNLEASKAAFNAAANEVLAGARNMGNDYGKELYVHDTLLDRVEYDLYAPLNQNAYSALVNGRTVCAGYARAYQYLMQQLGIPCYYCTGYAGENHAWNIIRLEGDYYNVDTTWDDTNPNTYDYFNKTDRDFANDHFREELSIYLPACNGTLYGNLESNPEEFGNGQDNMQETYNNPDDKLRTLEDIGFTEQEVLTSLEDYYANCYDYIIRKGGSTQFPNVVDENTMIALYDAYERKQYSGGYLERVIEELSADQGEFLIEYEELSGGRYLLDHTISIYF